MTGVRRKQLVVAVSEVGESIAQIHPVMYL